MWILFKDFRDFFNISVTKQQLLGPNRLRPYPFKTEELINSLNQGFIPIQGDIRQDFQKECIQNKPSLSQDNAKKTNNNANSNRSSQ